jgi:putative NADH-flavin reductase
MTKIVVFGGTGYTGGNIVREAASRGLDVVSVSRSAPAERVDGVTYEVGGVEGLAPRLIPGADVVVAALSPRGDMAGRLVEIYGDLARQAATAGARYVQIGGFNSLRPEAGAPRFAEGEIPEEYRAEALEGEATRQMLADSAPDDLDWLFVSPPAEYGVWAAGERTGSYRIGDEVALFDAAGRSHISGPDLAVALVDEIERPAHSGHVGIAC